MVNHNICDGFAHIKAGSSCDAITSGPLVASRLVGPGRQQLRAAQRELMLGLVCTMSGISCTIVLFLCHLQRGCEHAIC